MAGKAYLSLCCGIFTIPPGTRAGILREKTMAISRKTLVLGLCALALTVASLAFAAQRTVTNPAGASGPFSQSVAAGDIIYISGQIGLPPGEKQLPDGIEAQTRQCMANVKAALENAGSGLDKLVKVNVYLADMNDYNTVNKLYAEYFKKDFPARTCLEVSAIPMGALIEIEAVAVK